MERDYVLSRSPLIRHSDLEPAFLAARGVFWTRVSILEELSIIRRARAGERRFADLVEESHWDYIRRYRDEVRERRRELSQVVTPEYRAIFLVLFGKRLRKLRREAGLSQAELGSRSNFDRSEVSRIERGLRNPNQEEIARLAMGLRTSIPTLMGGKYIREVVCPSGLWPLIMGHSSREVKLPPEYWTHSAGEPDMRPVARE
jgi:transcriptional regulator with XRE-family HTH domain